MTLSVALTHLIVVYKGSRYNIYSSGDDDERTEEEPFLVFRH